jgi:hypothetical protein
MTTFRQREIVDSDGKRIGLSGPAQHLACELLGGGHIRLSSRAGASASGSACWRCGTNLSSDHQVRVVDSVAEAREIDARDREDV